MFILVAVPIVWLFLLPVQHAIVNRCVMPKISHVSGTTLQILATIHYHYPLVIAKATARHVVLFTIAKVWVWIANGMPLLVLVSIIHIA